MILKKRLFQRIEPSREAKTIYIFCEGVRREAHYFNYFREIDSRINIEVYPLEHNDNNSPIGLFDIASKCIIKSDENPNPKYEFIKNVDEVWFVIDTDSWGQKIDLLREKCSTIKDWMIAQSNPCFEVWLYFHFSDSFPNFKEMKKSRNWKTFLNGIVAGGFDSRSHPIFIERAINNAKKNYKETKNCPDLGCTEVFKLGKSIFILTKEKIANGLKTMKL